MFTFCKMHGLGNDFMVVDAIHQTIDLKKIPISLLADRHLGVGFDQLLLITPSTKADFACRIYNADGSEAEQCGNGMRCIARYLHEEQLTQKKSLSIETISGLIHVKIINYDMIEVNMGMPSFEPEKIPFITHHPAYHYDIKPDPDMPAMHFTVLSMGNPHAILIVPSINDAPVATIGSKIASHALFPKGTNVGFMEIVNRGHIRLRTFERGTGETFACGTNACASVVAGIIHHELDQKVNVELNYGNLLIEWGGKNTPAILAGSATRVFNGTYFI